MDESSPFMKQLVSSDRQVRDKALTSLRTYLTSGAPLSPLDLLKLWKALFFAMWHQDRPLPQQKLATSLADLALALPDQLFLPFMRAFWATMAREWTNIDALRMDKFLRLVRVYVGAGFEWCQRGKWGDGRVEGWVDVVRSWPLSLPGDGEEMGDGDEAKYAGGELRAGTRMVGDGLRYHVLDVYVDELEKVDGEERRAPIEKLMQPVQRLVKQGHTKALRDRAKESAADDRLQEWASGNGTGATKKGRASTKAEPEDDDDEEEFTGLDGD